MIETTIKNSFDTIKNTLSALNPTLSSKHNAIKKLENSLSTIDLMLNKAISSILHHQEFQSLESSYLGLHYLISRQEKVESVHVRAIHLSQAEALKLSNTTDHIEKNPLYKKIYHDGFNTPGEYPYSLLVGDYYFDHSEQDIQTIKYFSRIAEKNFSPFLSSASPQLFGFNNWESLDSPASLTSLFDSRAYTQWREMRKLKSTRFVSLCLPRVLARSPYRKAIHGVDEDSESSNQHCWINAAFALTSCIIKAHEKYAWATAIRGLEGGGKVEALPIVSIDEKTLCPCEVQINDEREHELSELGFLALCHYKHTDYAVFFGANSLYKTPLYHQSQANANEQIAARLPYLLASSRFAHYLKIMARDKIGSFMEIQDCEVWLNQWILNYVNANPNTKQSMKARFPLAEARINIIAGETPGSYQAVAWIRPWLQFEQLSASLRLVAEIPKDRS